MTHIRREIVIAIVEDIEHDSIGIEVTVPDGMTTLEVIGLMEIGKTQHLQSKHNQAPTAEQSQPHTRHPDEQADVRRRITEHAEHRPSSLGGDGLGYGPCVGCGQLWPCFTSRYERKVDREWSPIGRPADISEACGAENRQITDDARLCDGSGRTCPRHGAVT